MVLRVFSVALAIALAGYGHASDGVIRRLVWQVETSDPVPRNWPLVYGETVDFEVRLLDHTAPMDLSGAAVVLHARTNGMDSGWSFQATGSVGEARGWARVRVAVDTLLPQGLSSASYVVAVTAPGQTNNLSAAGTLRLSGTGFGVYEAPLPAPLGVELSARMEALESAMTSVSNAAWLTVETDTQALAVVAGHTNRTDNPHAVTADQVGALKPANTNGWEVGPHAEWLTVETDTLALSALSSNRSTRIYDPSGLPYWIDGTGGVWHVQTGAWQVTVPEAAITFTLPELEREFRATQYVFNKPDGAYTFLMTPGAAIDVSLVRWDDLAIWENTDAGTNSPITLPFMFPATQNASMTWHDAIVLTNLIDSLAYHSELDSTARLFVRSEYGQATNLNIVSGTATNMTFSGTMTYNGVSLATVSITNEIVSAIVSYVHLRSSSPNATTADNRVVSNYTYSASYGAWTVNRADGIVTNLVAGDYEVSMSAALLQGNSNPIITLTTNGVSSGITMMDYSGDGRGCAVSGILFDLPANTRITMYHGGVGNVKYQSLTIKRLR